jgi:hypothetical protein
MSRVVAMLVLLAAAELAAAASPPSHDAWYDFVPGRFALIGRLPDSGPAYTGSAVISASKNGFSLVRKVGTRSVTAKGAIEVPSPPGEGKVLRFRWRDQAPHRLTCLVLGDLDNYARLTCLLEIEGQRHKQPGLEAYFATAAWPETPP